MRERRNHKRQRGAAAVEFALVLPLFVLLVMGAIDWGWYFYVAQVVTNATREGARAGTLVAPDDHTGAADAADQTVRQYLNNTNLSEDKADIRPAVTGAGNNTVQVTVIYSDRSVTGLSDSFIPPSVTVTAQMRRF